MRRSLVGLLSACAAFAFAAGVDINTADQATLESVKGIGTDLSSRILDERKKARFRDWPDLMRRVKGIGTSTAGKLTAAGLTIDGKAYDASSAPPQPIRPPSAARH
jgi:competence protein ComEA